jgi:large repetitive protein
VALNTPPTDAVTIALSCDDDAEATVSPATLTFTPSDWDTAQTVTVTGVDDDDDDGDRPVVITTAPCESGDPAYAGIDPANVSLTNLDDDEATGGGSDPDAGPGNDVGNDVGNGSDGGCFIDGLSTAYRTRAGALP